MRILWSASGWADLDRLHGFLAEIDLDAADKVFDLLVNAPAALNEFPRRGPRLSQFDPKKIRELRFGNYLLRYELYQEEVHVLRFFHERENRP